MPTELWTKLAADAPILLVLLLVLWKGGEKLDGLGDKFDKLGERFDKMTIAVRSMSSKIELVGKLTDARLELHEERTSGTGKHGTITTAVAATLVRGVNGSPSSAPARASHPSWAEIAPASPDEDEVT